MEQDSYDGSAQEAAQPGAAEIEEGARGAATEASTEAVEAELAEHAEVSNEGSPQDPRGELELPGGGGESAGEFLVDAYYADLGDPALGQLLAQRPELVPEVVIGTDDRVRIQGTASYPWRAICSLRITAADGSRWIGTGWFISPRTVMTAGHCVHMASRGGWVREIEVIPGRNGSSEPYGSAIGRRFYSVKGWTNKQKRSHDYGCILLGQEDGLGSTVGWFGFGHYRKRTLKDLLVNLSGYPGDKPSGTQWWHARRIKSVSSRVLTYDIDTFGGQSGSPVWWLRDGKRYAVGIHTNGSLSGNSATRIARPVFDNMKSWKQRGS